AVISLRSLFNGNESMKLVMSDEASVPKTLYKYISPEHIPQLYNGIYGTDDNLKTVPVSRVLAKGGETFTIKIEGIRAHAKVWWDVVAGGSYFEYSCRFVPDEEARLAKMVQNQVKEKRVSHCYTAKEPGKIVISIHSRVTNCKFLVAGGDDGHIQMHFILLWDAIDATIKGQTINLNIVVYGHESNEDENNKKKNDNKKNAKKHKRKPGGGIRNETAKCWKYFDLKIEQPDGSDRP
nr:hypothetical protein [Tanacetum cinerariifolium]